MSPYGTKWDSARFSPGILDRISVVVDFAERRQTYLGSRNREGLLKLASEYDAFHMPIAARACRKEAERL
jgi:hypothetical protein